MPYFATDEGWIAYRTLGTGPPLLMLHGALGTAVAHLGRLADRLADHFSLIMPDLPGHGSSSPRDHFRADYYAVDALNIGRLVESLGITEVGVLGFSDGGMMAVSLAADRPDLVRRLISIGGQAYIDEPTVAGLRSWSDPESMPLGWRQAFARLHGEPYWRELCRAYVEGQERILASGGEVTLQRLSQITCPTLIMHGRDDTVIDVLHAAILAEGIRDATLQVFDACGHLVLRDQEKAAETAIREFLAVATNA